MNGKIYHSIKQTICKFTNRLSRFILVVSSPTQNQSEKEGIEYLRTNVFYRLVLYFRSIGLLPIGYGASLFFKENNIIAGSFEYWYLLAL